MKPDVHVTGVERHFDPNDFIVSKTDTKGIITYTNRVFMDVAGYTEEELLGKPHNLIRHPQMPRCVFAVLWDGIQAGREVFAFVVNRCKNGDHYWVFAHVTPTFDETGRIVGYHSNRRVPERTILDHTIIPLYRALLQEEQRHSNPREALAGSLALVEQQLKQHGMSYEEWIFSLMADHGGGLH